MEIYRLLQIGDVHYPDSANSKPSVDHKDHGFPGRISDDIGQAPLQAVCRRLSRLIGEVDPDAIAFMGDFTDKGKIPSLQECADYLRLQVPSTWAGKIATHTVTCIGNHDIARATASDGTARFENVNAVLTSAGFPAASITEPTELRWSGGRASVHVHGINTSMGCGETRLIPPIIRPAVIQALTDLEASGAATSILDQLYESIDTPAISETAISQLRGKIESSGNHTINIICGHHNILPQNTPRIAPYSELINAGSFRNTLLSLEKPVVYLHGHVHDDPYETIRSPVKRRSAVICVSAPLLRDGFNLLEIASNEDGMPLGVQVIPFRRAGNQVEKRSPIDIPFWPTLEGLGHATRHSRELIDRLTSQQLRYCSDLERESGLQPNVFQDCILELRWLGLIEIQNPTSAPNQWRVLRVI